LNFVRSGRYNSICRRAGPGLLQRLGLALAVLLSSATPLHAEPSAVKDYELKAAYIFNFAKFARWSSAGSTGVPNPLVIGVLGDSRVAASLAALTSGRNISGSGIEVRVLEPGAIAPDVRLLYVAASEDAVLPKLASQLFLPERLTIGESDQFRENGGIIRLVVQADRLQFEIDNSRAQKAGVTLSSQLLMLARRVF
jgi:hypothetical protein